ncbi:MAG: hypothetical protein LBS82_02790 [Spirochaetaceae bacterium]|jgi:hypothetical protein|nr:hypothetical protein [Spirochaetaceae bacterium]
MKTRILLSAFVFAAIALQPLLHAQPIDVTIGGGLDNLAVDTQKLDGNYNLKSGAFELRPAWSARINGEIGRNFLFDVTYRQDPFWQSSFSGMFGLIFGAVHAGLGVQIGMHDYASGDFSYEKMSSWDTGLLGCFKLEYPGYFFVGTDFVADFWGDMSEEGRSSRPYLSVFGGFWLPYILITITYFQKEYVETKAAGVKARAALTKVGAELEFFSKSSPFRVSIGGGWLRQAISLSGGGAARETFADYFNADLGFSLELGLYARWFVKGGIPLDGLAPALAKFIFNTGFTFTIFGNK